jgi:triacylglycerol lipase
LVPTLDLFLEEHIDYAKRLAKVGVVVALYDYPGGFHGCDLHPTARVSVKARENSHAAPRPALYPADTVKDAA